MGLLVLLMTRSPSIRPSVLPSFLKERGPVRQSRGLLSSGRMGSQGLLLSSRACGHLLPLLSLPFERWERRLSQCWSHRGSRAEVFLGEECKWRSACCSSSLGPRAEAPEATTITALGRGSARPPGPRRGRLWHTTGADHWSCETLLQVSSSRCPVETECSPTRERNHPA